MPSAIRTFAAYWLPLIVYVSLIFIMSSFSRPPDFASLGIPDKLLHFTEYALVAMLAARAFGSLPRPEGFWALLGLTLLAVCLLGVADELYQSTVPRRTPDPLDWLADAAGGLVGGAVYLLIRGAHARRTKESAG